MSPYTFPFYRFLFGVLGAPDRIDIFFRVRGELHQHGVDVYQGATQGERDYLLRSIDKKTRRLIGDSPVEWLANWPKATDAPPLASAMSPFKLRVIGRPYVRLGIVLYTPWFDAGVGLHLNWVPYLKVFYRL